jgi:hypothetical protein
MERAGTTTMAAAMMEVQDEECELSSWVVSVHDLPDEVLVAVFALLEPIHHAAAITLTCRRWRDVFHSDPPLWRAFHERLIGGPLVPALITGPALPSYYACVAGDQVSCQLDKQMRAVDREAWFSHNEWRAAVEWKVSRVREWGITPEGRIEWAALLGCSRLLAALLERHWHALSGTGRAHEAVTKALRAAACANDVDSVKVMCVCVCVLMRVLLTPMRVAHKHRCCCSEEHARVESRRGLRRTSRTSAWHVRR